jgi:uncharacterized damage-inducible protein DinB
MTFASIERRHPGTIGDERATLTEFLDFYRATLATKCADLTPEQLAERAVPPSGLSLLGLVRHMAEVERGWFRKYNGEETLPRYYDLKDNPDGDFDDASGEQDQVDDAFDFWQDEIAHAREVTAQFALDDVHELARDVRRDFSLRWILVHMIEEYARHCGHADLLRERIDGRTGD